MIKKSFILTPACCAAALISRLLRRRRPYSRLGRE